MIAHTPHQQVYTHHLALSLIILFLTVYPYLFNTSGSCGTVAAYSAEDFGLKHDIISRFDIIESLDIIVSKSISTRSAKGGGEDHDTDAITRNIKEGYRRIQFTSLGQRFDLMLHETPHLISNDFNVVALDQDGKSTIVPFNRSDLQVLEGYLLGSPASKATALHDKYNKLLTAQIKSSQDMIIVEPTYLHKNNLKSTDQQENSSILSANQRLLERTMIVYRLSDHEQFRDASLSTKAYDFPGDLCAATSASNNSYQSMPERPHKKQISPEIEDVFKYYKLSDDNMNGHDRMRSKRSIDFFYDQKQQVKEKTRCTLHLVADYLFYKHVGNGDLQTTINYLLALINRVNQIYLPTRWETGSESFSNIGFTVQNITIHQEFTRQSSSELHYNYNMSDKVWGARELLDNFSRHSPPKHYCLAHLLTYRQFDTPVLGLAYVASTRFGQIGGICSPTQQRGDALYKHNTGISTSKGIVGETLITRQADLVLAHELGHNLGAEHDSHDCRPPPSQGGAYLMHPYSVMGFEKNNRFLSNCSRVSIGRVIKRKGPTCFVALADNVCGNGVVEDDEECDGGDVGHAHSDPCCDSSCRFSPGSQCSDRHSWCCSNCRIVPAGRPCRPAEEFNCKQASYCDGRSASCPGAMPVEDGKICIGRGLCRNGECDPFCEARSLHSCLCNKPADACRLCCKTSINSTCVPYDMKAPYLPDGVLCYRGVCEKGRCEQPIQDVVERLWDVIEDINLSTVVKFLKDNIILVVLVVSIPLWCLATHFINEFDKRVRQDVVNTLMKYRNRRKNPSTRSPFLPRLFVGDDGNSSNSLNDIRDAANMPLKPVFQFPHVPGQGSRMKTSPSLTNGRGPAIGFQLPEGEEVVFEPMSSNLDMNSVELPHSTGKDLQIDDHEVYQGTNELYPSTRV